MDDIGCLKVDEYLRVEGTSDIFSIGDCSAANATAKTSVKATAHAELTAKNIQLTADGKTLKPYKQRKYKS